jgi:hypothetical protein
MDLPDRPEGELFKTASSISESPSWISSLIAQYVAWKKERRNPTVPAEITAAKDPSALSRFVDTRSPFRSLLSSLSGLVGDALQPRRIEMTAMPVEVEEMWSKHNVALPMLMAVLLCAALLALLLIPWPAAPTPAIITETAVLCRFSITQWPQPVLYLIPPVKSGKTCCSGSLDAIF